MGAPDRFTIDSDELDEVIADVSTCEGALDTLTQDLTRQMKVLKSVWEGLAADAHHEAHEEWTQGMETMREALRRPARSRPRGARQLHRSRRHERLDVGADPMRLDVSGTSYDSAAEAFTAGNHLAAMYYTSLTGKLGGYGAMAGDDKSSEEFVQGYDDMARETVGASADVVDAFATMASLTATSGQNHRDANAASVYKKPPPMYDGTGLPSDGPVDVAAYTPPSSLGGDNQDMPEFWNLVVDHLQGYAWPSADTGKLRSAAGTWRTMAGNLELLPRQVRHGKR